MASSSGKLGTKKESAIQALLLQRSVEEAARVTSVSARTLYRWIKEPAFAAAFREAKRTAFAQSSARLHQMAAAAVSVLGKAMLDPNAPAATRIRAADKILEHTAKAIELEDIEARLAELERAAEDDDEAGA